jgi:hypothetical protein
MWNTDYMDCVNNDRNPSDHAPFSPFYFSLPTRKREKEKLY